MNIKKIEEISMKKLVVAVLGVLVLNSCGKNDSDANTEFDEFEMMDNSTNYLSEITYEGTYQGKINNNEVELTLTDDDFEIQEGSKKIIGNWNMVNDGSIIELEPKKGKIKVRHYALSDNDTWVALTDSLTYIEPEQILRRTKN